MPSSRFTPLVKLLGQAWSPGSFGNLKVLVRISLQLAGPRGVLCPVTGTEPLSRCCLVAKLCPILLRLHGLEPARLLCSWDFQGQIPRVGCHSLLQGLFPTQGLNPCLPALKADTLQLNHQGNPNCPMVLPTNKYLWDFPGDSAARTPGFHCRGLGFNPWSGN